MPHPTMKHEHCCWAYISLTTAAVFFALITAGNIVFTLGAMRRLEGLLPVVPLFDAGAFALLRTSISALTLYYQRSTTN